MHSNRLCLCGLIALCGVFFTVMKSPAADPPSSTDSIMLENVHYRLFGNEKQGVAEIRLEGDQYRLRLFNEKLASYYSVKIAVEDLISTEPLGSSVSTSIHQQRSEMIRQRDLLRAERRKKAESEKQKSRDSTQGSSAVEKSRSGSSKGGTFHEEVSPGLGKSDYLTLLDDFGDRVKEMQERSREVFLAGEGFVSSLESWAEESESKPRVFHALKSESHAIVEAAEAVQKSLKSRMKEILRTREQTGQGHLRVRDLPEIIDRIRQRLVRCEEKLGELESLEMACSDGLVTLGNPIIHHKDESTQLAEARPVKKRRKASIPAPGQPIEKPVNVVPASFRAEEAAAPPKTRGGDAAETASPQVARVSSSPKSPEASVKAQKKTADDEGASSSPAGSGAREIILGAIIGALLVLGLGRLIKALP